MNNPIKELLTERRFASISEWGVLALLYRYANRYLPILQSVFKDDLNKVLNFIEKIAANGLGDTLPFASERILSNLYERNVESEAQKNAVQALKQFSLCLRSTWAESRESVLQSSQSALYYMIMTAKEFTKESLIQINDDIEALIKLSNSMEETGLRTPHQLSRGGPPDMVSQTIFARYMKFDDQKLIEVVPFIDDKLISHFRRFPEHLHELSGRQFEELIAEIFTGFGFSVELTVPLRDYGRDVIAVNHTKGLKYLIECKRWKKNVGLAIVQRMHGVARGEGATKGIIAATSQFTRQARTFLDSEYVRWQLDGRDFNGVIEWLNQYDKLKMARRFKI